MKFPNIRKVTLLDIFKLLIDDSIEILLDNGLSYRGKLIKAFRLDSNDVYIHLLDEKGMRYIIKTNDVTVITKEKEKIND